MNVNEAEYAKFAAACANGTPLAYFDVYLNRTISKFKRNAPGIAEQGIRRAILRAFKDRGRSFRMGKVGVKAGIATYRRWYTVKVPSGTEKYKIYGPFNPLTGKRTWTYGYRPKYSTKKVPLPNHHQPYVAFRIYPTSSASSSSGRPSSSNGSSSTNSSSSRRVSIRYSIRNATSRTETFRLPTGKEYTLRPGETRSYKNTGRQSGLKIHTRSGSFPLSNGSFSLKRSKRGGVYLSRR